MESIVNGPATAFPRLVLVWCVVAGVETREVLQYSTWAFSGLIESAYYAKQT